MPSQTNITNIPSSRVDFIDPRTGLMSREWYRFFLNLFNLTGAGNNPTSLDDLQLGPPSGGGEYTFGTVTSVNVSGGSTGLTTSGGPITSAGTITFAGTLNVANGGTGATNAADARTNLGAGTVTSVAATAGTGISVTGSPITTSGTLNITNTAPDQTVVLNDGTGISVTGTYPNFTITNTSPSSGGTVTSVTGTSPVVSSGGTTPAISLASGYGDTQNPYASKTANYVLAAPNGSAGVPTFRALVAADVPALSYVSSIGVTAPITSTGGLTPTIGITQAGTSTNGYLSSTDWNTFNNKQAAGTYVTSIAVASSNGFAGSSSGGATPTLTLSTSVTGMLKGNGTAISAGTAGTDYSAGTSALATGILKSTTTTGALSIAVAADFPTLNQNTTGTASNVTGVVAVANGGSGASTLTGYLKGNGTSAFTASATIPAADISGLTNYTTLPSSITVTSSPFTYTNATGYNADVLVSGGGVSKLEFSRDGTTFYDTGSYYGMFSLSPSDKLRVTYATTPTMTLIPR